MVKVWKIAPGEHAEDWEVCHEQGCIGLGWAELSDYRRFHDESEVLRSLKRAYAREKEGSRKGAAKSIWCFLDEVKPFDIVIANAGRRSVVGMGVVRSEYLPPKSPKNPIRNDERIQRRHARLVNRIIDKRIDLKQAYFFGIATITSLSAEKVGQIRQAYLATDPALKKTLDQLFAGTSTSDDVDDPTLAEDLREIDTRRIDATTKDALVSARVGQGRFRTQVLQLWRNRCAVTRSVTQAAIRASHIKPWRESTDEERLDPDNGLPLIASLDALFDAGLISFAPSGKLIVSTKLSTSERRIFGIGEESLTRTPTRKTAEYLAYHRRANGFRK